MSNDLETSLFYIEKGEIEIFVDNGENTLPTTFSKLKVTKIHLNI